jgi:hypothetical protein
MSLDAEKMRPDYLAGPELVSSGFAAAVGSRGRTRKRAAEAALSR